MSDPQRSCLYRCKVMHLRHEPLRRHFRYDVFMFGLELCELEHVARRIPWISRNRFNLYSYLDSDHIDLPGFLGENGIVLPEGSRVHLVTNLRTLGFVFNPVSFYFCADPAGELVCIVAEVENTFREKKAYLLPAAKAQAAADGYLHFTTPKEFYISPFIALDAEFRFKLKAPGDALDLRIDVVESGRTVLTTALTGRRAELSSTRVLFSLFQYPWITLKVIGLIHWNALKLYLRGVPFHRKSENPELQKGLVTKP